MRFVSVLAALNPTSWLSFVACGKAVAGEHVLPFSHNCHKSAITACTHPIFPDVFLCRQSSVDDATRNLNGSQLKNQKLKFVAAREYLITANSFSFGIAIRESADGDCLNSVSARVGLHDRTLPKLKKFPK